MPGEPRLKDSLWHGRPARDYAVVISQPCGFSHSPNEFPQPLRAALFNRAVFSSPGVYAWARNRRHYQRPINGAFETNRSFVPRRKRLGYGKVIQLGHCRFYQRLECVWTDSPFDLAPSSSWLVPALSLQFPDNSVNGRGTSLLRKRGKS